MKSTFKSIGFMIGIAWKKCKFVLFCCFTLTFLNLIYSLVQLFITPTIIEKVEQQVSVSDLLLSILFFSIILFVLSSVRKYLQQTQQQGWKTVRREVRSAINRKAFLTSYPNAMDSEAIKMRSNALHTTNGNSTAAEHIWQTLTSLLYNLAAAVIFMLLLSNVNTFMGGLVLFTCIVDFLFTQKLDQWGYLHRVEKEQAINQYHYISRQAESVTLAKDIRIFGLADWLLDIQKCAIDLYGDFVNHRERRRLAANIIHVLLTVTRNGITYGYFLYMILYRNLSVSDFLLYINAVGAFANQIVTLLGSFGELYRECQDLSVVQEYLNLPEPFHFTDGEMIPRADNYELCFDHVSFRYPGTKQIIFQDFNLTIHPGEKLAIVGLNGAGKTTLVKLLCGFYDPDEGRVLLNGIDIRTFNRREYYRLFSAVFQEYSLLEVTLKECVAQQFDNIDMERVVSCIDKAGLSEFVVKLPDGYDTYIGRTVYLNGILMSGGQTQRLLLARALYKDSPILILDEPTAALDPIAENDIYQKYHEMTTEKTSLFISHRLASTRFCDRILFFEKGNILEEGTHEQLLNKQGNYARLFEVQSRYYQEGRSIDYEG